MFLRLSKLLAAGLLLSVTEARAQLVISEFMADNTSALVDDEGDFEDWIEIWNTSTATVTTTGWSLTDAAGNPRKWFFPTISMAGNARRVVFASNKDRRNPALTLHTNFKLDNDGEYLALVDPSNGIATVFNPFPAQAPNISYGMIGTTPTSKVVAAGRGARWRVPVSTNDYATNFPGWNASLSFNDTQTWTAAATGVGYDLDTNVTGYLSLLGTNGNCKSAAYESNASVFVRIPFVVTNATQVSAAQLKMKYDDGFAAWINGTAVATDPDLTPASLDGFSRAVTNRNPLLNSSWAVFNLTNAVLPFVNGTNLLAIQVVNAASNDANILVLPELELTIGTTDSTNAYGYLYVPTPTNANSAGAFTIGPIFTKVTDEAARPVAGAGGSPLVVTANVVQALNPIAAVTLYYRTMFSGEVAVAMTGSGSVFKAAIPTTNLLAGQMLRWRYVAVDTANATNRMPPFLDPTNSAQYYGTVAFDASITSSLLPVFEWFIEDTAASITRPGTRGSFYFKGEFYDNCLINLHGQSSATFNKRPYDIYFNPDHYFKWEDNQPLAHSINILSDLGDKTKAHNPLSYELFRDCGAGYHWDFNVRVQRNGSFFAVYPMVENPGGRFLSRLGRDNEGALYKMYNEASAAAGNDKITRTWDPSGTADLTALITNLAPTVSIDTRRGYLYDNFEIPACLNYFVAANISSHQDHAHKNYYLYRDDPTNTGEWVIFPWDIDLTWGRNWLQSGGYFQDTLFTTNSLDFMTPQQTKPSNRVYYAFFEAPDFRQMYLRRLRTCMDTFLQTNGTPANQLRLEARLMELIDQMDPPGRTNSDAWLDYQAWMIPYGWGFTTNREARTEILRTIADHLPGRRAFLYGSNALMRGESIPDAQPAQVRLQFANMEVKPAGTQDREYFSIVNTNSFYVDVSGWSVTGAVNYTFKPGVVIPSGGGTTQNIGKLFVAKNVKGFRSRPSSPRAGEYCFVQGGYDGQLSARGGDLYLVDRAGNPVAYTNWGTNNVTAMQNQIRVTEIMYNPAPPTAAESNAIPYCTAEDFEYIEVRALTNGLFLSGLNFTIQFLEGIEVRYAPASLVSYTATSRWVFVANSNAFLLRYGSNLASQVIGTYTGLLDNAGERIQLVDGIGEVIQDFTFDDDWYPATDGLGFSLVPRNEANDWSAWSFKTNWRPSGVIGGTPGAADPGEVVNIPVVINEALTHTDLPQIDTIELWNPTNVPAGIGGWWLTDDFAVPRKYRIPTNTFVPAGGFLAFDESAFNNPTNALVPFRLSSTGDDVWLFSANPATSNLTGYAASRSFGASQNGVSFGRFVNRANDEFFVQQTALTPGLTNAYPRVWPVVVSEIMYHPRDFTTILWTNDNDRDEYIELTNVSASNTPLYDVNFPTNTWRIRNAVDYDFPTGVVLAVGQSLILVGFDPKTGTNAIAFRAAYGISTNVPLYGPWRGKLDNSGEQIELKRPDAPNTNEVPYITVEEIGYRDAAPWAAAADGTGMSLQRIELNAFGNDPYNWYPATPAPSVATDTSLDSDGDGAPDWAEYRAGTDPANPASFLQMTTAETTNTGTLVRWTGINGKTYTLEATTNLQDGAFVPVATGLPGLNPITTYIDPAATNLPLRHYRIRIEP